jgi:hypothetical protein
VNDAVGILATKEESAFLYVTKSEATSVYATKTELDALVTEERLTSATSGLVTTAIFSSTIADVRSELDGTMPTPVWNDAPILKTQSWHPFTSGIFYDAPQYARFQYGDAFLVKLRGEITENTNIENEFTLNGIDTRVLFVLPVGFRPAKRHLFLCAGGNGGVVATVLVNHNGHVLFMPASSVIPEPASLNTLWLDSISFFTA